MSSDLRRKRKRQANHDHSLESNLFKEFYLEYYKFVRASAMLSFKNECIAETLTQETFRKAARAFHRFDHRYPKAWLKRILRNVMIDHIKKVQKEQEVFAQTDFDLVEKLHLQEESFEMCPEDFELLERIVCGDREKVTQEVSQQIFDYWGKKYLSPELKDALEAISEDHRNIILAREVLDYNYIDIGVAFEIKEGTVMSRLSRARTALKQELNHRGIFGDSFEV